MALNKLDISVAKGDIIRAEHIQSIINTINSMLENGVGITTQVVSKLPTASEATVGKLYLVLLEDESGESNKYQEYITYKDSDGNYQWESLGTTSIVNLKDVSIYVDQLILGTSAGKDLIFQTCTLKETTLTDCSMLLGGHIDVDTIKISDSFELTGKNTQSQILAGTVCNGTTSDHDIDIFTTNNGTVNLYYQKATSQNVSDYSFNNAQTGILIAENQINVVGNVISSDTIIASTVDTESCYVTGALNMQKTGTITGCSAIQETLLNNSSVTGSIISTSKIINTSILNSSASLTSLTIDGPLNMSNNSTGLIINESEAMLYTNAINIPASILVNSSSTDQTSLADITLKKVKLIKTDGTYYSGQISSNSSSLIVTTAASEINASTLYINGETLKITEDNFNINDNNSGVYTENGYMRVTNSSNGAQILWNNDADYNTYGYDDAKSGIMVNNNINIKANNNIIANSNIIANKDLTVAGTLTANLSGDMITKIVSSLLSNSDFKKKLLPVGTIIDFYPQVSFGFDAIPDGYVPCGRFYKSSSANARLAEMNKWKARYSNISIIQDGTSSMAPGLRIISCNGLTIPDFTDRFTVQAGWSYDLGATGGLDKVTLTADQCALPTHSHTVSYEKGNLASGDDTWYNHSGGTGGSRTVQSSSTGKAEALEAHENRPPYLAVYKLMKVE